MQNNYILITQLVLCDYMPTLTITIPELFKKEIESIPKTGYYDNKSEFIRDAIRTLLSSRKELRIGVAVEMYKAGDISISKASEIAGINFEEMKKILFDRNIPLERGEDTRNVDEKAKQLMKMRK